MIATGNFGLAPGVIKRAVALNPDTHRGGFKLDHLYGDAAMAKVSHMESLAGWALEHGDSSDAYFLLGVSLAYDGQMDRAVKFMRRAADLAGVGGGHVAPFVADEAEPPVLAAGPATEVPDSPPPLRFTPVSAELEI